MVRYLKSKWDGNPLSPGFPLTTTAIKPLHKNTSWPIYSPLTGLLHSYRLHPPTTVTISLTPTLTPRQSQKQLKRDRVTQTKLFSSDVYVWQTRSPGNRGISGGGVLSQEYERGPKEKILLKPHFLWQTDPELSAGLWGHRGWCVSGFLSGCQDAALIHCGISSDRRRCQWLFNHYAEGVMFIPKETA